MYHRVLPRDEVLRDAVEPGMYVSPRTFAQHLDWLTEYFRVLPIHEIVTRLEQHRSLPPLACGITFDDGWRDNYDHALPELERRGLPATIFAVVERVGTEGCFWPDEVWRRMWPLSSGERRDLSRELGAVASRDPIHALLTHLKSFPEASRETQLERLRAATAAPQRRQRELLDWDELEHLSHVDIDIESHGATHAILTGLPDAQIERELRSAREGLRDRGHGRHGLLAYPSGGYDDRVRRIASELGYRAAFATTRGLVMATTDPMALPRLGLHEDVTRTRAEFLHKIPGRT
jgi:peptidoglycan/xylan/chitin deacetylase (PgdA/CDA1 family)